MACDVDNFRFFDGIVCSCGEDHDFDFKLNRNCRECGRWLLRNGNFYITKAMKRDGLYYDRDKNEFCYKENMEE